ncbi:peptide-methionine (S)-S-oxide reductase [Sphingorhabdus pulchriflava]|uniref:Peptide methionine sulfoxide reductase MsrA n=1 Tax=Sphingorhabdus pulchriflava TaxID=2292257 RepID=A0A371BIS8_9SPHN|nr:peptide-methionine (S)-S-oxide reductase MsrA [Sphingorhabdus pulchriflava]RDV07504.1 peptide-methionine (S)-S-oxide reductase [Sphingorhabdus pulchriflava]
MMKKLGHTLIAIISAMLVFASASASEARSKTETATAIFAMGCFWCAEADFEKVDGVIDVVSGYTGGRTRNPTYEQVSAGGTGHYEAVRVTYDPAKVKYSELLTVFWKNVDPFDAAGQFCDKGESYRAAIFPGSAAERKASLASRDYLAGFFKRDLVTKIEPRTAFYPAEDHHQDYYKKNPIRYRYYRSRCGRDDRLKDVWGK